MVVLRPQRPADLPLLPGGLSPYDEWGPQADDTEPRPCSLHENGRFTITDDDGTVCGDISWFWWSWGPNPGSKSPMIGIWLRPECRGRGIGTAAQRELIALIFRHTTANRVQAHTDVTNLAEQRSLERVGMRAEGTTRGAQWRDGAFHDGILYALTRADWLGAR